MSSPKSTPDVRGAATTENPLRALAKLGQAVWLDYIRRDLITTGELARLIAEDGLRGMTSNPSIFEKAITGSKDYADLLQRAEERKESGRHGHLRAARHPRYSGCRGHHAQRV